MKRFVCFMMVIGLWCSLFTACSKSSIVVINGPRNVVDMSGRTVEIPENVNKVFVDWAQGTLHMMTLGALDKVIAVRTAFDGEIFTWARMIYPNFDIVTRDDAPFSNLEALIAYEPDVVLTIEQGTFKADEYEKVGIPAVIVKFEDYETFRQSMTVIGNVLGGEYTVKAEKFNSFFFKNEALVKERLLNMSLDEKKLVHYVDGRVDDALRTVGHDQVEATWIKTAGSNFSTEEFTGRSIDLTEEKFLDLNPDIILVGSQQQASAMRWLLNNATLKHLDAVKNNNVYRIPQGIFPWCKMGPEASMQMVWAAKFLHPDKFTDIDVVQMAKGFYRDFLGADVADEYINKILEGRLTPTGE